MVCFCAVVKSTPAPEPLSVAGVWAHTATGATHSAKTNANRWFRCMIDFKLPPGHGARHICNHRLFTSAPCKRPWMRHSRFSSATGNGLIHQGKAEATRDGAPEPPPVLRLSQRKLPSRHHQDQSNPERLHAHPTRFAS